MRQLEDTEIIKLVLQGQQAQYGLLVARYQHFVFTLALRFVKNREEAEEIAQDAFVKAYRCLSDYRAEGKFSTWLYTIVRTTALSTLRTRKGNVILAEPEQLNAVFENQNTNTATVSITEQRSQQDLIRKAINYLPETDAQVLTLFYTAEQSLEEIGLILGLNANHVKVRLFRARQKLRDVLETKYPNELKHLK
ncbi:MAG: sigma-70 family RNA polymerase sigma factor [Sphingobacteriales bacterium]|nr:MAG: sigma-70 family RNA polymerase sigma factor [Sphingobacteriales bacterium]